MPRPGARLCSLSTLVVLLASAGCPSTASVNRCVSSADCAPRWACVNEACRAPCNASADCLSTEHCSDGLCLPGARGDAAAGVDLPPGDGGVPDQSAVDASATDSQPLDVSASDQGSVDAGPTDRAGAADGSAPTDATSPDLSPVDRGSVDQLTPDSATADSCVPLDCTGLGLGCGPATDGCGRPLSCGTCPDGAWCLGGLSCAPPPLVFVPAAATTFAMGSPTTEAGRDLFDGDSTTTLDETLHSVRLTRRIEAATTEVSQGAFALLLGYNPAYFSACGDSCPVERVSWSEAARWCNALSDARSLERCYSCVGEGAAVQCRLRQDLATPYGCAGYRLPTEAEWERLARAGTSSAVFSGAIAGATDSCVDEPSLDSVAWYLRNGGVSYAGSVALTCDTVSIEIGTHPVGALGANNLGLHDVAGNVWEWVHDCAAPYPSGAQDDPLAPETCDDVRRVFRGGSVGRSGPWLRHAERAVGAGAGLRAIDIGFRPVRSLP